MCGFQELPPGRRADLSATNVLGIPPGAEALLSQEATEGTALLPRVVRKASAREVTSELTLECDSFARPRKGGITFHPEATAQVKA